MKDVFNDEVMLDDTTDEWRQVSARVAWIFWLTEYKERTGEQDHDITLAKWAEAAPAYRAYARKALRLLQKEGIGLVKG